MDRLFHKVGGSARQYQEKMAGTKSGQKAQQRQISTLKDMMVYEERRFTFHHRLFTVTLC
jgi:hypothetical protein